MSSLNYDELMQPVINFLGCTTPQAWLDEAPDLAQQIQAEIDANIASMQAHLKNAKAA